MVKMPFLALALSAALATSVTAATPPPLLGRQYLSHAKVSPARAQLTATAVVRGTVISRELEREKGGSGLRYSFDIRVGDVVHEVGIDAITGRVLENSIDDGSD
jgi:uncharacterized membrane protein YkoI